MQRNPILILGSVVLLIALVSIARWFWPATPRINPDRFIGLGQVLAEETVKVVGGHGRVAVVINVQHQFSDNPASAELASFQSGLKKHKSISVVATEVVAADPNEMAFGNSLSEAQLQAILTKHAAADAIVFLVDLPEWDLLQARGRAPQPSPAKIIVALSGSVPTKSEYAGYFANGFLSVLIGGLGRAAVVQPKTPREWFDQHYQVYTAENFATLPE